MRSAKIKKTWLRDTWMWTKWAKNYKQRGVSWGFNPVIKLQFIYIYRNSSCKISNCRIHLMVYHENPCEKTFHDSHNRGKISPTHFTPQTYLKGCLHVYPNFIGFGRSFFRVAGHSPRTFARSSLQGGLGTDGSGWEIPIEPPWFTHENNWDQWMIL